MKRYCYNCINDCEKLRGNLCMIAVAPYAGAWIEISPQGNRNIYAVSLPTRERGLKWQFGYGYPRQDGRSLRGSVD